MVCLSIACNDEAARIANGERFGHDIESLVRTAEFKEINPRVNYRIYVGRVLRKEPLSKDQLSSITHEISSERFIGRIIENQAAAYRDFTYLKTYLDQGRLYNLFRFSEDDAFDYLVVELKEDGGQLKIVDGTLFSRGISFVEEIRNLAIFRLWRQDEEAYDQSYALVMIKKALVEGDLDLATQLFSSVPEQYQKTKVFSTLELAISLALNSDDLKKKQELFLERFPEEKRHVLYQSIVWNFESKQCTDLEQEVDDFLVTVANDEWLRELVRRCKVRETKI